MGRTMSEKILAKAAGRVVGVGDFVWAKVHVVSLADYVKHCAFFDRNDFKVWDPNRILFCFDHFQYPHHGLGVVGLPKIRSWASRQGIPKGNIYDIGRQGNSNQIPAEEGWVLPGTVYVAADTQGATMGALNCFAVAALEASAYTMATGEIWFKVPECIRVKLRGRLPKGVLGKDIYLRLLKDLGGESEGRVIELTGPGVSSMSVDIRLGVANGANHLGAQAMIFPADQKLMDYLAPRAREPFEAVEPDPDAHYVATYEYDLDAFEPLIAGPDDHHKVRPLGEVHDTKVQAAYIGSCSSGRFDDLALAAEVLKGRTVSPDVRLVVTPISSNVMREAAEAGLLAIFAQAGATLTTPSCGACFYGNQSPLLLDDGETCITASVENWPGRMGSSSAKIYLANAAVVAASAVEGRIVSPHGYYAGVDKSGEGEGGVE